MGIISTAAPAAQAGEKLSGLTSREAEERLRKFGTNDPSPPRQRSAVAEFLLLFANPLVIILLFAAVISGFIGQWFEVT